MASNGRASDVRTWIAGIAALMVVLLGLVLAYQYGFDRGQKDIQAITPRSGSGSAQSGGESGGAKTDGAAAQSGDQSGQSAGKDKFASTCGGCHTLAAAGTSGTAGPKLDDLKPDAKRVLAAIKKGGTGSGAMPPNLLRGAEAEQVAEFVASSAGR